MMQRYQKRTGQACTRASVVKIKRLITFSDRKGTYKWFIMDSQYGIYLGSCYNQLFSSFIHNKQQVLIDQVDRYFHTFPASPFKRV